MGRSPLERDKPSPTGGHFTISGLRLRQALFLIVSAEYLGVVRRPVDESGYPLDEVKQVDGEPAGNPVMISPARGSTTAGSAAASDSPEEVTKRPESRLS